MNKRYTERELTTTIEKLIELLKPHLSDEHFDKICQEDPIIEEVNQFGPGGPCGMGLGYYGGHAI